MIYIFDNGMGDDDHAIYFAEESASFLTWWRNVFSPWQEALREKNPVSNLLFLTASAPTIEVLDPELVKLRKFNTISSWMFFADAAGKQDAGRLAPPQWVDDPEVCP